MAEAEAVNDKTAGSTKAPCDVTTIAFVSFLRSEAEAAEIRAKQLWAQADKLIYDHGLEQHFQSVPKKLGGKKAKRKRINDPERNRRKQLTGYTLFMKEVNPTVREEDPSLGNQDVVQKVAQLWSEKSDAQKQEWKSKAEKHNNEVVAKTDLGVDKAKANNLERNVDNEGDKAEANKKNETSDIV